MTSHGQTKSAPMEQMQKAPRPIDHLLALLNGKGLAHRLSADGQTGDQRRNADRNEYALHIQPRLKPRHDHRAGSTGDDTADIAHHIVADA